MILDPQMVRYLEQFVCLSPCQKIIQQQNAKMPEGHMQIRPELGQFLSFLLKIIKPHRILELGTYTGFSALTFALATPLTTQVMTIDRNLEWTKLAKRFWREAKVDDRIQLLYGDAAHVLKELKDQECAPFDFIFIDACKHAYEDYVNLCLPILSDHGIIAVDNVLWRGLVVDETSSDANVGYMQKFNQAIAEREDVEMTIVPLDDGLMLIRQK